MAAAGVREGLGGEVRGPGGALRRDGLALVDDGLVDGRLGGGRGRRRFASIGVRAGVGGTRRRIAGCFGGRGGRGRFDRGLRRRAPTRDRRRVSASGPRAAGAPRGDPQGGHGERRRRRSIDHVHGDGTARSPGRPARNRSCRSRASGSLPSGCSSGDRHRPARCVGCSVGAIRAAPRAGAVAGSVVGFAAEAGIADVASSRNASRFVAWRRRTNVKTASVTGSKP